MTLDNVPANVICDEIWMEEGYDLRFTTAQDMDCGVGSCFFGVEPMYVWLFPSRLSVDLLTLSDIQKIEIDVEDFCAVNCTQAFLYDAAGNAIDQVGNTMISSPETITVSNLSGGLLSQLAVSSCEGKILEIRIFHDTIMSIMELEQVKMVAYPNPGSSETDLHLSIGDLRGGTVLDAIQIMDLNGRMLYQLDKITAPK